MEYLTLTSDIRIVIRGFTKQADADKAKFSLLRRDNQKKILDNTSPKVTKVSALDPLLWELTVDADIMKTALEDTEMSCRIFVSITAGGNTWSPPAQEYVLYRNKITLTAKNDQGAVLPGAHCTCTIRPPTDFQPKSTNRATSTATFLDIADAAGPWKPLPRTVITGADGKVDLPLDAPGELDLEWAFPHYPKDQPAWLAQSGVSRETVLLERQRKARFVWPELTNGAMQKHYVNLVNAPGTNRGRVLRVAVDIENGRAGDKIFLTVELTSSDSKGLDGQALKCDVEGDLEVGKPKKSIALTLESDNGTKTVEIDFMGYGGITAKLSVSTVEGSSDEKIDVTSWRRVSVQSYQPAAGFFDGDAFPDAIVQKVKKAYDAVFTEFEFLEPLLLTDAFDGFEKAGDIEIVKVSRQRALDIDFNPGNRQGDAAMLWFKIATPNYPTPAHWVKNRPDADGRGYRYSAVYRSNPQTTLHVFFGHFIYVPKVVTIDLTLSGGKLVSDVQTTTTVLKPRNIDEAENAGRDLILPWRSNEPSYWQVEGEDRRGEVTMDFIEIDREKARQGIYEYKVKLPDGASGDPKALAGAGKRINIKAKLRGFQFGVAGEGLNPVLYVGLPPGDEALARGAYTVIHELAHALGFAPPKGDFYYNLAGDHCAYGAKNDAETFVSSNSGTVGPTVHATMVNSGTGKNVPLELVKQGKFGQCVMFGQTHRQKTTESQFSAALMFCSSCAPLMRVTPLAAKCGGGA